jgi:hypothetical protein
MIKRNAELGVLAAMQVSDWRAEDTLSVCGYRLVVCWEKRTYGFEPWSFEPLRALPDTFTSVVAGSTSRCNVYPNGVSISTRSQLDMLFVPFGLGHDEGEIGGQ